jgi:cell division protein FtsB
MNYGLHLSGVQIESLEADSQHPNKMKFRGVICRLDEASSKPPNGAQGHRIFVPTEVAKRRLKTLIGMGLNYAPDLDSHSQRRKVGVINKAWIDGKDLRVEGHVWKHDFPEAEKDLKQAGLGMSMELGDVRVDDPKADVWTLDDFQFLGATILWRDSAAYNRTQAIAARAEQRGGSMSITKTKRTPARTSHGTDRLVQIAAEAAAGAVKKSSRQILEVLKTQTDTLGEITAQNEELESRIAALESGHVDAAGDAASSSSSSSSDGEVGAKAATSSSSSSASSSASSDEDDMETRGKVKAKAAPASSSSSSSEDVDADVDTGDLEEIEKAKGNTGHANEDAENRGDDGAGELAKKVGPTVAAQQIKALRKKLHAERDKTAKLRTSNEQLQASVAKLTKKIDKVSKQVTAASESLGRRSVSPEISAMLAKSNISASDMYAAGTKLSVEEVDGVIKASGLSLSPQDSMAMKNGFLKAGLMEDGRVERGSNR